MYAQPTEDKLIEIGGLNLDPGETGSVMVPVRDETLVPKRPYPMLIFRWDGTRNQWVVRSCEHIAIDPQNRNLSDAQT